MATATDYDAPRRNQIEEPDEDSLEALQARRTDTQSGTIDVDETDLNEALELPGADLSALSEDEQRSGAGRGHGRAREPDDRRSRRDRVGRVDARVR